MEPQIYGHLLNNMKTPTYNMTNSAISFKNKIYRLIENFISYQIIYSRHAKNIFE